MKRYILPLLAMACFFQAKAQNENYVRSYTATIPTTSVSTVTEGTKAQRQVVTQYFDGLGRPMQVVNQEASPGGKDIIQPIKYDEYGREAKKYLPYVYNATNGYPRPQSSVETEQDYFYNPSNTSSLADKVARDADPFSVTIFEPSPLNRVLQQGAPGDDWQPSTGRAIEFGYSANIAREVLNWQIQSNGTLRTADEPYYASGRLYKNITTDEHDKKVIEYIDLQGRTILKKAQVDNTVNDTRHEGWACTYYVYDNFGNLRYVLPPELIRSIITSSVSQYEANGGTVYAANTTLPTGTNTQKHFYLPWVTITLPVGFTGGTNFQVLLLPFEMTAQMLNDWAFQYKYDARQRMVEKKVPGADWVYMVYDQRDRLVLTQDGNQRENNRWIFTKYDALNRPVSTGIKTISGSRSSLQSEVDAFYENNPSKFYEVRSGNSTGADHGYTDQSYPTGIATNDYLTVTYYDDYNFTTDTDLVYPTSPPSPYSANVKLDNPKGQVTGGKVKRLDNNSWMTSTVYYDNKYRVIYTSAENHMSGHEKVYSKYDFVGNLLNSRHVHTASGQSTLTTNRQYTYDHAGRLLDVKYRVGDSGSYTTISRNAYNELGELVAKKLHSTDGATFKQTIDYRYNIRGWLTTINDPDNVNISGGDYFGMELMYNNPQASSQLSSAPQFNGNISEIHWKNAQDNTRKTYGFRYDNLNRLTHSAYGEGTTYSTKKNFFNENIGAYDYNGNIERLTRTGNATSTAQIDNLSYTYTGNRLIGVADAATGTNGEMGFDDGNSGQDYWYDANGNMTKDLNKDITGITYNYLNLPRLITFADGNQVTYVYDAAGTKLQKIVTKGTETTTTNYAGGLIYEGTDDKFLNTEEGRIVLKEGGTAKTEYQYHLKDHLGNVRLTFTTAAGGTTSSYMATMETENAGYEEQVFSNVAETRQIDQVYNHTGEEMTATGTANASARLNAAEGKAMGPWTSLHVMPGDTVRMSVYAKYDRPTKTREAISGMAGIIAGAITGGAADVEGIQQISRSIGETLKGGQAALLAKNNNVPKAYLNYIFFDAEMQSKSTNFTQVTEAAHGSFEKLEMEFIAEEEGYLMTYTANETNEDLNVFMDDFTVMHTTGPIVRVDDYYPFGLTFNSSKLDGKLTNKFLYNGKEKEELTDWYDYGARMYDAALGRFFTQDRFAEKYYDFSPYQYAANNPILYIDINGDSILIKHKGENIIYKNGNLYWAKTGKAYDGKALKVKKDGTTKLKGFVGKVKNALNDIENGGDVGSDLISSIENHSSYAVIRKGSNRASVTSINWNPSNTSSGLDTEGGTLRPAYVGLSHELAHVWDVISDGTIDQSTWYIESNGQQIPNAEKYALHIENQIRAENELPLRTHYGKRVNLETGAASAGGGRVIVEGTKNRSVYYKKHINGLPSIPFTYGVHKGL